MVDVGSKTPTQRIAIAKGQIAMQKGTLDLIIANNIVKGDVLTVSKVAGIMGAKRTSELIPLCHPLSLSSIDVKLAIDDALPGVNITAEVKKWAGFRPLFPGSEGSCGSPRRPGSGLGSTTGGGEKWAAEPHF
mgnify:CR=1 FL=1